MIRKRFIHNNIFVLLIIFNEMVIPYFCIKIIKEIISVNEITLIINGTGNQRILSNNTNILNPSLLDVNGNPLNGTKTVNLNSELSTIKIIWDSPFSNCSAMFRDLDNIVEINLSNFNSSLLTDTGEMFYGCYSLKSLNLSNFNTSKVNNMANMFQDCESLEVLDISSFDTSFVENMGHMFKGCRSLKSLKFE